MDFALFLLLIVALAAVVIGTVFATKAAVRRAAASSAGAIDREFDRDQIQRKDPMANYFGLESKGGKQVRGNGALVLTADDLWFRRIGASEALRVPRGSITGTSVVRSHAGKTVGRPLVRVAFDGPNGPDAAAWYVADAEAWASALRPCPR